MKEIGELLRRTREEKGISLQEVQVATKIRTKYLKALEEGDDSVIPAEVYAKGFLRSYAGFLGLDEREIVKKYSEWKGSQRPKEEEPANSSPLVPSFRPIPKRRFAAPAWIVILVLVFGAVTWGLIEYGKAVNDNEVVTEQPPDEPRQEEEENPPVVEEKEPEPLSPPFEVLSEDVKEVRVSVNAPGLKISAIPSEVCWVEVRADDKVVFQGNLRGGVAVNWEAREKLWIRMGKPWVVTFEVNGQTFGPVSEGEGPPKNVTFIRSN